MKTVSELQNEIYQNKVRRDFNVTDIGKEIVLLTEELGELASAYKSGDVSEQVDAYGDMIVLCLGGLRILGKSAQEVIEGIVENNKTRTHKSFL